MCKRDSRIIKWEGEGNARFTEERRTYFDFVGYFVQKNGEIAFNLWFDKTPNRWYNIITVRQGSESGRAKKFKEI